MKYNLKFNIFLSKIPEIVDFCILHKRLNSIFLHLFCIHVLKEFQIQFLKYILHQDNSEEVFSSVSIYLYFHQGIINIY